MRVLITGASGGIGKECVRQFAAIKDCEVIAISRSIDLLEKLKAECQEYYKKDIDVLSIDFHEAGFQNKIADYLKSKKGGLDILINNAGLLVNKSFGELNQIDIQEQMRINFEAPLILIQSLISLLKDSKSKAHVVNISSMGGFQGSVKFPGLSVYSASKGALSILTECLAAEYDDDDIAFNSLALGSADTEMLRKAFPGYKSPMTPSKMAEFIVEFSINGHQFFNGKVLPVASLST